MAELRWRGERQEGSLTAFGMTCRWRSVDCCAGRMPALQSELRRMVLVDGRKESES
jgi:hypothetical protein